MTPAWRSRGALFRARREACGLTRRDIVVLCGAPTVVLVAAWETGYVRIPPHIWGRLDDLATEAQTHPLAWAVERDAIQGHRPEES